ncbi:MAG: hypothetical protein RJA70_1406 [Pseudomonadota bacterium]|jgi:tetratricopeptide (TPR) repeat protein
MSESESIPTLAALQRSAHEFLKSSQWVAARQVLIQASEVYPESADVYSDLAAAERALGQLDQAILHYQRSLEIDPKLAFVHNNLGNALSEKGQLRDAIDCYHRALVLQPRYPEALNNLAKVLLREGRLDEARRALDRLFGLSREYLPAFETLAVLCERQGNVQEAMQHYLSLAAHYLKAADSERALWGMEACRRLGHRSAGLEANRCAAFLQLGRFEEARDAGFAALQLDPNHANAHVNLGSAYVALGDYRSAVALQRRATELAPTLAEAFINLASSLLECEDPQNALIAENRALELEPTNPRALSGLAQCYQTLGRRAEAADLYRRALGFAPTFAEAHTKYGQLLLSEGLLPEGFKEFEWRRSEPAAKKWNTRYPGAMWAGQDLSGKTIVLFAEGNHADVVHFARYCSAFKQRGARVIVDCRTPLHRLISGQSYVDEVVDATEAGPPSFDYYAPLLSLPHVFGTAANTIPDPGGYMKPPAAGPAAELLSGAVGIKIGVSWAGDPRQKGTRQRSMSFEQLAPLFDLSGVAWFSLQVGPERAQLSRIQHPLTDLGVTFSDFADTAWAISQLDLIITVDSTVAHIAGALGKAVWVMLPHQADWRWMVDREDSPWYKRARLFRQQPVAGWEPLVGNLKRQLGYSLVKLAQVATRASASVAPPPVVPSSGAGVPVLPQMSTPAAPQPASAVTTSEAPPLVADALEGSQSLGDGPSPELPVAPPAALSDDTPLQ